MIISRASQTARLIGVMRSMKGAKRRRGSMPRQIPPKLLEIEYGRKLSAFVVPRVRAAFADFERQIPSILASAALRADAFTLDAGEGKEIRKLIADARARMHKTIMTSEIEDLASMYASNTASYQKQQLARQTRAALGVDPFIADHRLQPLTEAFVDANVGLIKKLTDDVAGRIETQAISAVQNGTLWTDFRDQLETSFGFTESRSELIARDQTGKLYGQLNASRQRELGVTSFIWRTSEDDRVREEHEALDGETFSYDDPPDEGLPGEPIQCRCTAEPDFSDILGEASDDKEDTAQETPDDKTATVPEAPDQAPEVVVPVVTNHEATARRLVEAGGSADAVDSDLIARQMMRMPPAVLHDLEAAGTRVIAARDSITDVSRELKGITPRGWPPGKTWDDVPGGFDITRNQVIVATREWAGKREIAINHGSWNVVAHESGHALDRARGWESRNNPAFQKAYQADVSRGKLSSYLTQPGTAGAEESYAESFAAYVEGAKPTGEFHHLLNFWKDRHG